jgi:cell division septation protein DedD
VSDTIHDHADDGFHEIQLSGKQLVFLFMATTVVSVVIFLLGVWVGRGVPVQQAAEPFADPALMASAPAPSPVPVPVADGGILADEPPAPPEEAAEELSFKRRLEGEGTRETLDRTPPAAGRPAAPPARQAQQPQTHPQTRPASQEPAQRAAASAPAAGQAQPGTWVVQVHALRDRGVANGIVKRLSDKGYPAFLVASGPPSGIYRVQVGRFRDRTEAERVLERLSKEEQYKPWITR